MNPKRVSKIKARKVITTRKPRGTFYTHDGIFYVGIDNRTGDAWTEDFVSKTACIKWLKEGGN